MTRRARALMLSGLGLLLGIGVLFIRNGLDKAPAGREAAMPESDIALFAEGIDVGRLDEALAEVGVTRPPGAPRVLVIVFSTEDCGACLSEAAVWEKLHRQYEARGLRVLGVGHGRDREELNAFVQDEGLTFEVHWDEFETVKEKLHLLNTPGKILVDESGAILLADPPNNSPRRQREFEERVGQLMGT